MCGIHFSLSHSENASPDKKTEELLINRGPDSTGCRRCTIDIPNLPPLYATFTSTVLALRGLSVVAQPLQDPSSGSVLCWNGEAWSLGGQSIDGNDSHFIFKHLVQTCQQFSPDRRSEAIKVVVSLLASIRGPYAFLFYDARHNYIFYGRDCLGRRSLLHSANTDSLTLSSVCANRKANGGSSWEEVDADGIYYIDLVSRPLRPGHIPQRPCENADNPPEIAITLPFPSLNRSLPDGSCSSDPMHLRRLDASLRRSIELRVKHVRESLGPSIEPAAEFPSQVAILFSGGLDCTILARLAHDCLPLTERIDLLNVAFENPRVHAKLGPNESPYATCPDRITGRSSYAELRRVCPERLWRFVEVDVPYSETLSHRERILDLIYPHNTEMDLSIAYALYFASRGSGVVFDSDDQATAYTTSAHVLLSGLGADELFGGYQRHSLAFARCGYEGLIDELELDFTRLGKRNLGRDDRVISDSGREVRFPYLDEDFIAVALEMPVTTKCDFGDEQVELEPGKRILRMLAWELGMEGVAKEKKRAIQFGARTAKMETGRTKGTQIIS
ncbi:hypothetical protein M011DRAFT_438052 [Sporormia fimetaria CBS 119925]|uniref:Glutamine amidotransferase type-2 domain-containing protein n=1 Tax=Sporormia fimetaria CBS 119925 TaxID=1340428 RepID=A0A6A6VLY9_9PLEO|nr:hypothetical protein M011DRAFT_438052 [Sporormia fimetaria CBS 119925]